VRNAVNLDVERLQHHAVIGDILLDQERARGPAALFIDPGFDVELV